MVTVPLLISIFGMFSTKDVIFINVSTVRLSGVEFPVLATASNITFAKTISPLTPLRFHADIMASPMVLLMFSALIFESELPVTSVTCTTAGSYSIFIVPVP